MSENARAVDVYDVSVQRIRGWARLRGLVGWLVSSLATAGSGMLPPERVAIVTDPRSGEMVARVRDRWDLYAGGWDASGGNSVDTLLQDHQDLNADEFASRWLQR